MQSHFRAVLFDLDGTLADSLLDLANAVNHALAALGCPAHPVAAYRHMVGDGARTLCQRALPSHRQDAADDALRLMREHYSVHCFDETRLYPGIPELVTALSQRGCKLAVLSNKPDVFTRQMIAHFFQPSPFDVVCGQLQEVPVKPNPASALRIAEALRVPPAGWLYLGDTNTDMQTATAAGMYPVGVLWGFRDREELIACGAKTLIEKPSDLLPLL